MIILSKEQVLILHERLIEATGGSTGIRDEGMLDSALSNPFQSFGDQECPNLISHDWGIIIKIQIDLQSHVQQI